MCGGIGDESGLLDLVLVLSFRDGLDGYKSCPDSFCIAWDLARCFSRVMVLVWKLEDQALTGSFDGMAIGTHLEQSSTSTLITTEMVATSTDRRASGEDRSFNNDATWYGSELPPRCIPI
jgi:hypothetical protein